MKNNVSTEDLRVFLAVFDEEGFRAAAKRLQAAPSKVSTTVSKIEKHLGVPLFLRSTRSVQPTDHGRRLAEQIKPLLAAADAALAEMASSTGQVRGRLKLNVPGAVVPDILPPLLSAFHRSHPAVEIEIMVENDLVDIIAAGCDAGIRYGAHLAKDMISIPIGPGVQQIALAASPSYVREHGMPESPADLMSHEAIRYRLPGGTLLPWTLRRGDESMTVEPNAGLVISVNALNSGLSYARQGMGIIGTFRNWLADDFRTGLLTPILKEWWSDLPGPRLYYPSRFTAAPLRAFIETCRNHSAQDWLHSS